MAAAPQLPFVSEEEYLRTDYEPNCEYVDGVVVPKALPNGTHSALQKLLCCLLTASEQSHRVLVCPELHVPIRPGRHRVPDVAIMPDTFTAKNRLPPLAVIDIVSRSDTWYGIHARIDDMRSIGTLWTVVVDSERRNLFLADADAVLTQVRSPLVIRLPLPDRPELTIDFDKLFADIPQEPDFEW